MSANTAVSTGFSRIDRLPPYVFNVVGDLKMAARRRGEDIIDFSMGNPDQPTPKHIVDKMVEAAQRGDTHRYSVSRGIPRLRLAICNWYTTRYGVDIDPDKEAIVTIGSKEGLAHLAMATVDRGDAVLVPNPAYPIHPYGFVIAGADIRHVPIGPGVDFFHELDSAIKNSWPKPKMLLLNFPSNPTAQCVDLDFFERVVAVAREHNIYVVHDLAYADLVFDGYKAPSIMQVPGAKDFCVEFFTLSKSYNMPGWRIGFMVGNPDLVYALARLKSYLDYGMFTPIQVAAIAALEGPQDCVAEIRGMYQQRREVLWEGLQAVGWGVVSTHAGIYRSGLYSRSTSRRSGPWPDDDRPLLHRTCAQGSRLQLRHLVPGCTGRDLSRRHARGRYARGRSGARLCLRRLGRPTSRAPHDRRFAPRPRIS